MEKDLDFGGKIKCEPETLSIEAYQYGTFIMSFAPGDEGRFIEKVEFLIEESKEVIHFIMT